MRSLLAIALLLFCCLGLRTACAEGQARVLLVGCDRFLSQPDTEPASANNVDQMGILFRQSGLNVASIVAYPNGAAGVAQLQQMAAQAFQGADEGDVNYFYISTHGLWTQGMDNGDFTLVLSNGISEEGCCAWDLRRIFDEVPGTVVLLVDACHSGAMIGKGVLPPFDNAFEGGKYKLLCSSGGAEESWYWSGPRVDDTGALAGEGYFSGALAAGLSAANGMPADENRDGEVTLAEVTRYLRAHHGASTVHSYPTDDGFCLFRASETARNTPPALTGISFDISGLSPAEAELSFSFTVTRPVRVAYQVVYQRNGEWDFDRAVLRYDAEEPQAARNSLEGWVSAGFKQRTVSLTPEDTASHGYALLQLLVYDGGEMSVAASHLLCVQPERGDPNLAVLVSGDLCPARGQELTAVALHSLPCELTVAVEAEDGSVVQRLAVDAASRPEQLALNGSSFSWNGRLSDGRTASAGVYRLRVSCMLGGVRYTAWSQDFRLLQE